MFDTIIVETPSHKDCMFLREITRAVISLVENMSGCPVVVSEDASLKTLAASRIARGTNRIHSISPGNTPPPKRSLAGKKFTERTAKLPRAIEGQ